jgi:hypothetical protein
MTPRDVVWFVWVMGQGSPPEYLGPYSDKAFATFVMLLLPMTVATWLGEAHHGTAETWMRLHKPYESTAVDSGAAK